MQEARQSAQLAKLKEKEAKRAAITQKMEQVFNEAQQKRDAMESSNKAEFEERAAEDAAQRQLQREEMWRAIDKYSLLAPKCYNSTASLSITSIYTESAGFCEQHARI